MSNIGKEKNFISVVVYLHNEEPKLKDFLDYIVGQLSDNFEKSEIIFVNDASAESNITAVKEYMSSTGCRIMTNIVNLSSFHGVEAAMLAGEDLAIGDFVFEFDNMSMDYPKELFMQVYNTALSGYDIVAAAPEGKTGIMASAFYMIYNSFRKSGRGMKLMSETFRIVSRRAINRVKMLSETVPYRKVMYQNCGLGYKNIKYKPLIADRRRYHADEKLNRTDLAFDTLLMFTNFVQKLATVFSLIFMIFTISVGVYTVVVYLSPDKPVEGWAPLMGVLSVGFSGMFMLMALMMKYMSVLLNVTFTKKQYLVASIDKLNN